MTAEEFVAAGLTACLPPGVPLGCEILSARRTGKQKAIAAVRLFDGLQGAVEVSQDPHFFNAWVIGWKDTGGSPIEWTGTAWRRVPFVQMTLFDLPGGA